MHTNTHSGLSYEKMKTNNRNERTKFQKPGHRMLHYECIEERLLLTEFFVTNPANDGTGTLREAVFLSSLELESYNTIRFAETLLAANGGQVTINLQSPINVNHPVQIIGPGDGRVTIDGGGITELFKVDHDDLEDDVRNGLAFAPHLDKFTVFSGLTFTDGHANGGSEITGVGGAIGTREPLYVTDAVFEGNSADLRGGAIGAFKAPVNGEALIVVEDSSFIDNTATGSGGAIDLQYSGYAALEPYSLLDIGVKGFAVSGSVFRGNTSSEGGAIFVALDESGVSGFSSTTFLGATIQDSQFIQNKALDDGDNFFLEHGGAVNISSTFLFSDAPVTVERNLFSNNEAEAGKGGAVYLSSFSLDQDIFFTQNFFDGNEAVQGGAFYGRVTGDPSVHLEHSTFSNNSAANAVQGQASRGGAIYFEASGSFDEGSFAIHNSTISDNEAVDGGGGLFIDLNSSSLAARLTNTTIVNNRSFSAASLSGGGGVVFVDGPSVGSNATIQNSVVASNLRQGQADDLIATRFGSPDTINLSTDPVVGSVGNVIGSGGSAGLQNGVGDNQVGATFDTLAGIGLGSLSEGRYQSMPVHLPQPGSLLIDRGSDLAAQAAGLETDQLGFERFLDGDPLVNGTTPRVDIGAVEYNPAGLFSERVATEVFVDFTGLTEALNDLAVRAQLQDGSGGDFVFSNGDVSGIETKILNELANTFVEFEGISFTTAPPTGPHDTITFGETSLNPFVLGTSEGHAIDFRNIFGSAVGRVFTSSFAVVLNNTNFPPETNVAPQSPELDGLIVDLGVLLGGTGAHELIHTMGIQHYDAYGDPDITPAATGGAQNDYLIATGSTGLTATGRLASRVLSPLTKAKLEFAYGTTNVLPPDSIEDPATNSTATLATEIDLVGLPISGYAGANVLGELSTAGGSDWYRIDLSAGEDLSVNAISPTRTPFQIGVVDMGLRVYRDDGSTLTTPLAENKDLVYTANWIGDKGEVPPTEVVLFGGDYSGSVDDALALNIPITTSGSYLIEVFDPSNQGTGFYDLFVAAESSVTSPRVTDVTFIGMAGGVAAEVSMDARVALSQQLDNLALGSVTAVRIDFDLPIDAFQPSDLEVTALISEATATQPVVSGVSYDPAMTSATWTFNSSLPTNVFSLRVKDTLQSSGVALDGDWVNPSLPGEASGMATEITSGNNTPGSDFVFAFTALPADFNSDEVLDLLDLDVLGSNFGTTPATYLQGDANGDNSVDLLDLDLLGGNFGFAAFAESLAMLVASADYDGVNGTNEDDRDEFDSLFLAEDSLADLNGDGDFDSTDEALFDLFVDLNVS